VATLSVTSLIVLLVMGLLSLSTLARRSASSQLARAEAQANARLAMVLAIGQLQKEMGPDSRISAPPDAGTTATGGQSRWSAVYDAWRINPNDTTGRWSPSSRVPNFRSWLVSGAAGDTVPTGNLIPLVGAGSLGGNPEAGHLVSAPLVNIANRGKQGGVAWWTADESVKAKINAGAATDNFPAVSNPLFDAQSPPRIAIQAIPQLGSFEWSTGQRALAITTGEVNLAAGLGSPGIGRINHDITLHSAGVLSDVREGRLKRDLSNLLTRSIAEVEDKPLYLADGRLNRFAIGANGSVTNAPGIPGVSNRRTSSEWGINLEELFLFHNLHREILWSGNTPRILSKNSREAAANDRFFLYRKPSIDAAQFILSLKAVPDTAAGRYKMVVMLDGMVGVSNPNDMIFEYAPGLQLGFQLLKVPYQLRWDIRRAGAVLISSVQPVAANLQQFKGYVGGGPDATAAAGFSLLPGESGVFGSSTSGTFTLSLTRGFLPSGGVQLDNNLGASNLLPTDTIDFTMERTNATVNNLYYTNEFSSNVWNYCNIWLGRRGFDGKNNGWHIGALASLGAPPTTDPFVNQLLPPKIEPPQISKVSDFLTPKPFMILSFLRNVEQSAPGTVPDAFASRPFLMSESANSMVGMTLSNLATSSHMSQFVMKVEPANYQFRTLAAGPGGRNLYQGGSRQPTQGGSFFLLKRRIPFAPPLSLGAFENAIASGFARRFRDQSPIGDGTDPFPSTARTLGGESPATPVVAKAIGNSYASPFLAGNEIYRSFSSPNGGTDHSWMVNNALWDPWFLSGIVDGRGAGSNPFQTDNRSPRAQFNDLARGTGLLRNRRFVFHPHLSPDSALQELFNGEFFKPSAINDLGKYLFVDGAFNVNSTSETAWKAFLMSLRNQELILGGGARKTFGNPYGTLGYAQTDSSTDDWTGLRDLSDMDIDRLAKAMVDEVKARGPFLNMGDFVNRRPNGFPAEQAVGALQAAIDKSGLNSRFAVGGRSLVDSDFGTLIGRGVVSAEPAAARSAGSAGHLGQARLLAAFGSQITVRSDTFVIRTYGDTRDASGRIISKAWCEAVVQRLPEYVDPTDRPEASRGWPTASARLTTTNSQFGRRIVTRSFRWLNGEEI
jgi:type II secretory pathway pseudopilin PulG